MEVVWKCDITSDGTENAICFCTCVLFKYNMKMLIVSCEGSAFQSGEGIMMTSQNAGFAGPRNVASNAFLRQSPSPSALQSSPAGLGAAPPRYTFVLVLTVFFFFLRFCVFRICNEFSLAHLYL
jgi:hypothetical protein